MKKNLRKIGMFALGITVMSACQKDNNPPPTIVLGDTVQSMNLIGENAYVMVNNSAKIEVFSTESFTNGYFITNEGNYNSANGSIFFVDQYNNSEEIDITPMHVNTIDVVSPRYMAKVSDDKAYVTDWGINGVQVIDLATNTVTSTISCGAGPEGITVANGFAYVCNVGGWSVDNTVSVIKTSTDALETTLTVGDKPNSVVVDVNGAVWVLTGGYTEYDSDWNVVSETAGNLVKIADNTIEATYAFTVGNHPEDLVINDAGTKLYYSDGSWSKAVYAFDITDTELSTTALINRSFYGLGFNDGYIYGTDAVDFTQSGWSYRYTTDGTIIDSVQVGIIPGGYCFN
jgi:YVTN family beta-propeller protein